MASKQGIVMNITPNWTFSAGLLVIGICGGAFVTYGIMEGRIHDRDLTIANMKTTAAVDVSKQSQEALANLTAATRIVKDAAQTGQVDISTLSAKLDTMNRKYNAKPPAPLPVDCKPGTQRVQQLTEGAAAVDQALSRPVSVK